MADLNKYWALKAIKERCAPHCISECVLHTAFYEKNPWSLRLADHRAWRGVAMVKSRNPLKVHLVI